MRRRNRSPREGLAFGLLLMAIGVVLLVNQLGYADLRLWLLWPWFVIGWGIVRIATWESPRRVGGGVSTLIFGIWFWIAVNGWRGLGWEDTWPLALVAVGSGIITRVALQRVWPAGGDPDEWKDAGGRGGDASGSAGGAS